MKAKTILLVTAVLLSFKICNTQVLQFGTCAEVETMRFFNLEKFLGKWYEIERFPTWYEAYGQCAFKNIEACGRRIEIEHGFVRDGIQYILHVNSTYIPGDEAIFFIEQNSIDPIGIPLSVIETDYSDYAIVYGCKNFTSMGFKYISAWILSRNQTISEEIRSQAYSTLNSIPSANTAYLERVAQVEERCTYQWTAHVQAEVNEN